MELNSVKAYYKLILSNSKSKILRSSDIVNVIKVTPAEADFLFEDTFSYKEIADLITKAETDFIPIYSWQMDITISSNEDANKIFYFFWTLTESLSKIGDTKVIITDIIKGSVLVRLKIFFKDILAKKETKELLSKAYESGKAIIDKPTLEGKKIQQETELIKMQAQTLIDPDVQAERDKLVNLKIRAEIEKANAEALQLKIDAIKKISDLMQDGILQIDSLNWDINGILFLVKNKGIINLKASIDDIDSKTNIEKGN